MAHRIAGRRLSRSTSHRLAMFRNQVTDLVRHGKIVTTEAKAREVRSIAEKVITLGKHGTLHARRQALRIVSDKDVMKKIFDDLGPRYASRPGGYTRMIKLGPRQGDGASMAQLELVEEEEGEE
jgi:large subunit ribosomal protein L17